MKDIDGSLCENDEIGHLPRVNEISENPKAVAGRQRFPQLSVVPSTSLAWLAEAHADGATKYGALNWRRDAHSMSSLIDAAIRHLLALKEGEDAAQDSLLPHAAHVMAGMSVLLDAQACGTLIDDRVEPRKDAWEKVRGEIARIRERRAASKSPIVEQG